MNKGGYTNLEHKRPLMQKQTIRFGAVGDLLLSTRPNSETSGRGMEAIADDVRSLFETCDIVFANLECTLPGRLKVATEPRVVSTETQVRSLQNSSIGVVTLANNHIFDCMEDGFQHTRDILNAIGVPWFGVGCNLTEALSPAIINVKGLRLGFLGAVHKTTGQSCFANETSFGAARLDVEPLCQRIENLRRDVDHVIVSLHWGKERYRIPSPQQIEQGRKIVDAGASMILGHHPHVLQGMEIYRNAPILYSLGNFIANDVYYSNGDSFTWSRFERTSCVFIAEVSANGVENVTQTPVFDNGEKVLVDTSHYGARCLNRVNRCLTRGVTPKRYQREKFYIEFIKPILNHLKWSELQRLRLRHFHKALQLIWQWR